jgi:TRAP-type C4-dicarboxylate transport system permease small subunit
MNIGSLIKAGKNLEERFSRLILAAVVALVFLAALTRFFGMPINWSVEIAQALFVWVIYLGANQAWRNSRHIGVDLVYMRLGARVRFTLDLVIYIIIAVFLVSLIIGGIYVSVVNVRRVLNALPISYSFVTMAVPFGSFLMLMTTIEKIVRLFQPLTAKGKED